MTTTVNSLPKQILVAIQRVNGKECVVPVCPKAKIFAELTGTKTLNKMAIEKIQFLGYTVKVRQEVKSLHSLMA